MTRYVALRASGLGDLLCVVPALSALRSAGRTELWTSPWLVPFARAHGLGHEVRPVASIADVPPASLEGAIAVNLHGSGPESHRFLLTAGPRVLWGHRHGDVPESSDGPTWREGEHEVDRWRRLLGHYGVDAHRTSLRLTPPVTPVPGAPVLLHVGAGAPGRRWPADRWSRIAARLRRDGMPVRLSGGPGEDRRLRWIAQSSRVGERAIVPTNLDLLSFSAVVAGAAAVVVGDTGVAHLATAFDRPSVVLFGPVPPAEWGPPPGPRHIALWAGRRGDPHGRDLDPGLAELGVHEVWRALRRILDGAAAEPTPGRWADEPTASARQAGRPRSSIFGSAGEVLDCGSPSAESVEPSSSGSRPPQ